MSVQLTQFTLTPEAMSASFAVPSASTRGTSTGREAPGRRWG